LGLKKIAKHGSNRKRRRDADEELEKALAEAEADVKAGRVSGRYKTADALVRDAITPGKRHRNSPDA